VTAAAQGDWGEARRCRWRVLRMAADVDARATDAAGVAAEGSAAGGRPTGREGGGEPLWRSGRGARGAGEPLWRSGHGARGGGGGREQTTESGEED